MNETARLFFSYAHEDTDLRDLLEKHLTALQREGVIESWHDRAIAPGEHWDGSISEHLERAEIILLLISVHFLASPYCTGKEMERALERDKLREAVVIPIILRPVDWDNAPFRHLQFLPSEGRPVVKWGNRDEAFVDIARGIRKAVANLRAKSGLPKNSSAPGGMSQPDSEPRQRVLDAAMPRKIALGKPADFDVMVRLANSAGLKAVLQSEEEYLSRPEDVREKPFLLEFPTDPFGMPAPAVLTLKLDAPDFEPPKQSKPLRVPPDGNSDVCTFFVTPLFTGELMLNLEVYSGEDRRASKVIKILAEQSDRAVKGRVLVSVPISTVVSGAAAKSVPVATASFEAPLPQPYAYAPRPAGASPAPAPMSPPQRKKKRAWAPSAAIAAAVLAVSGTSLYLLQSPQFSKTSTVAVIQEVTAAADPPSVEPPLPHSTRGKGRSPAAVQRPAPAGWETAYNAGVIALKSGKKEEAEKQFQLARQSGPTESKPVAALAEIHLSRAGELTGGAKAEELAKTAEMAQQAIALDPNSADSYLVQGIALHQSGKLPEAEAALRKATELSPGRADAWYALGSVLQDGKNDTQAAVAFHKALELNPEDANARLKLSAVLAKNDPPEARKHLDVVLSGKTSATDRQIEAAHKMAVVVH